MKISQLLWIGRRGGQPRTFRTLFLELLEDRTVPTIATPHYTALLGTMASLKPLPASIAEGDGGRLLLLPSASLAARLGGSAAPMSATATTSPLKEASPASLVNNPGEEVNIPNPQDTQSETTLVVIPGVGNKPAQVVSAFNDSGSFDPFSQFTLPAATEAKFTGYALSTDGGKSFADKGTLPTNANGDLGDPVLARDGSSGTVYLTTLPFGEFINGPSLSVFRSYDGGATFALPVNAAPGLSQSDLVNKPWSTVDNFPGPGKGNVYEVFTAIGASTRIMLTHSTDGGQTWGPSGGTLVTDAGMGSALGAYVTVGPDHAVYVFWLEQARGAKTANVIKMAKSTDRGTTFAPPVIVATLKTMSPGGDLGLAGVGGKAFRTNAFPQAAVSPIDSKAVYLVYNDAGLAAGDKADVYFTQSSDGGSSWGAPTRVNRDATKNDQWQPSLAVTPDGLHVGVFWYDRRADPNNYLIKRFGAVADFRRAGPTLFTSNFAYSDTAFPPVNGLDPAIAAAYMGDYDQTVADNGFFYTTWGDNRSPSAAHAGNNADVRLAKIPVSGLLTIPANVLVNDPMEAPINTPADTQSESALVVVPGPTPTIVSAFNDTGSFDIYGAGPTNRFTGYSRSSNGGASFIDKGKLPANPLGDAGDPVLARDNVSGKIYLSTVPFAEDVSAVSGVLVFRSADNGASFTKPVDTAPGFSGSGFVDKPWITVDNAAGPGQGDVYQVFTNIAVTGGGIFLTRSTDGGATWGPSGGIRIASADFTNTLNTGADVVVGKDHSVYVFYLNQDVFSGAARIVMRRSMDFGASFGRPVVVSTLRVTEAGGNLGLTDDIGRAFRTNAFPQAAVNPSTGAVYVVYNDRGTAAADKADIYFRQSRDGGTTWSGPIRLNDDKTMNDQWQPALAVTPDGSRVGVFWYDRRLDPNNNLIDRFGAVLDVAGPAIVARANIRVTQNSFVPTFGQDPLAAMDYMGDYDQAAADNNYFYTTWGDNSLRSQGHAGFNADVRFAKVRVAAETMLAVGSTTQLVLQPLVATSSSTKEKRAFVNSAVVTRDKNSPISNPEEVQIAGSSPRVDEGYHLVAAMKSRMSDPASVLEKSANADPFE